LNLDLNATLDVVVDRVQTGHMGSVSERAAPQAARTIRGSVHASARSRSIDHLDGGDHVLVRGHDHGRDHEHLDVDVNDNVPSVDAL
jgi:hypothetical protein